jgi:hypothetical protein
MFKVFAHWILGLLADGDFVEVLAIWILAVATPLVGPMIAFAAFADLFAKAGAGKTDRTFLLLMAVGSTVASVASGAVLIVLVANFREAIRVTMAAGGGFIVMAILCLALFPLAWTGHRLRGAVKLRSQRLALQAATGLSIVALVVGIMYWTGGSLLGINRYWSVA